MRLLLDTHVVLWLAVDSGCVTSKVREVVMDATERWVSAASCYELAQKVRAGRLPTAGPILDNWTQVLADFRSVELPLTGIQMTRAGRMDWSHRDPFDRILVAQAQLEGLTVATADRALHDHPEVATFWA